MNPALRSLIIEDCLSLWIGLSKFILSLLFFADVEIPDLGTEANVQNAFSSSSAIDLNIYESFSGFAIPGLLREVIYNFFNTVK